MQKIWVWTLGWEDPWRRAWQLTPVFLPRKSHGQRRLTDYSPCGHKELATAEATEHTRTHTHLTKSKPSHYKLHREERVSELRYPKSKEFRKYLKTVHRSALWEHKIKLSQVRGGGAVVWLSHVWLFCWPQAPLSIEFSRQEYWSGLPFPSPGDLPHLGIEPKAPACRQGDSWLLSHRGSLN